MEQEHKKLWAALERLAPKAVEKQKKYYANGKLRLPPMRLIFKIIKSSGAAWSDFAKFMDRSNLNG